jgi:hypothetical protein
MDPWRRVKAMVVAMMVIPATIFPFTSWASADLSTLNNSMLAAYYTQDQLCVLNKSTGDNKNPETLILNECRKELNYSNGLQYGFQATRPHYDKNTCCSREKQLGNRDFDKALTGMEDGNLYPLKDFFDILSDKNQGIMLLGDSIAQTTIFTMVGEIERMMKMGGIGGRLVKPKDYSKVYDVESWEYTPPPRLDGRPRNAVRIYMALIHDFAFADDLGEVKMFAKREVAARVEKLKVLATSCHPEGLMIIGNIGAHLTIDRTRPDPLRRILNQRISQYILWLNDFTIMNPKNKVFWRESFPVHFSSVDGSYEKWKDSAAEKLDLQRQGQDGSLYHCKPLQNTTKEMMYSQAPENGIAERVLDNWPESRVKRFPAWAFFAPFWKLHCGSCEDSFMMNKRINKLDCLHFCGYAPPMWTPFWVQLVDMVSSYPELTPDEEIEWKKQKLSFGGTPYERMKDSRVIESDGMYYLIEFGVKRLIVDGRPAVNILFQRTVKDSEIASVSAEELSRFPDVFEVKPFMRDDTVIKETTSMNYFLMKNFIRHKMLDHDMAEAFMKNHSIPAWEIRNIPKNVLKLIPLGEALTDIS